MNIIEQLVYDRTVELLGEVEAIAEELIAEEENKRSSQKVADFTSLGTIPPHLLQRLAVVQLQITLLKGTLE